jgi:UDP-N-acetylmuramate dehydrogenase
MTTILPAMILPSGLEILARVPLASFSSWQVGGAADYLAQPKNELELREVLIWARENQQAISIVGGGTNLLISDCGIRGLTIVLRKFSGIEQVIEKDGRLILQCLAGTSKSELLKTFLKRQLAPALFLAGIPGDLGGGIAMNAGVGESMQPREFVELVDWIEVLRWTEDKLDLVRFNSQELTWNYRHCVGWQPGIIVRAGLSWFIDPIEDLLNQVKKANQNRLSKQPLDMPSCGSVFMNPPGHKAGQLIEKCGLKGFSIGGAKVSEKHANFIVNSGRATAANIDQVISHVKQEVFSRENVKLQTEVVYMGKWT